MTSFIPYAVFLDSMLRQEEACRRVPVRAVDDRVHPDARSTVAQVRQEVGYWAASDVAHLLMHDMAWGIADGMGACDD